MNTGTSVEPYRTPRSVSWLNRASKGVLCGGAVFVAVPIVALTAWYVLVYLVHWVSDAPSGTHDGQVRAYCNAVRPALESSRSLGDLYGPDSPFNRRPDQLTNLDDCRHVWEHGIVPTFAAGKVFWLTLGDLFMGLLVMAGLLWLAGWVLGSFSRRYYRRRVVLAEQQRAKMLEAARTQPYCLCELTRSRARWGSSEAVTLQISRVGGSAPLEVKRPSDELSWLQGGEAAQQWVVFPAADCDGAGKPRLCGPVVVVSPHNIYDLPLYQLPNVL